MNLILLPPLSFLLLFLPSVRGDSPSFDCHISVNNLKFDLTSSAGEHIVNHTRTMPPSVMVESLRFNLCGDLKKLQGLADHDQCEPGTRACLTQVNRKPEETDRVVSVIPLMQTSSLNLTYESGASTSKFISIISNGPDYPHPIHSTPTPQSLNVTLLCTPEGTNDPTFRSYDGSQLRVEWKTAAGCPLQKNDDSKHDHNDGEVQEPGQSHESTSSGMGWFFLMLVFAFAAYFGLGAYYNYSTYGARGADLIPHRDFWKEVPYMFADVISHLCSTVRPRRTSNHGYIAV